MQPPPPNHLPRNFAIAALVLLAAAFAIAIAGQHKPEATADQYIDWLTVVAAAGAASAFVAIVKGAIGVRRRANGRGPIIAACLTLVAAGATWLMGVVTIALSAVSAYGGGGWYGGAWGRPLRARGRQLHPSLTEGADWTHGPRPDASRLDPATRRALEALWLHDAQKEHASVPAFARVSWLLAAAGAPAELLAWTSRAGIEEIEHARACFALAAGYGGRSFTVEPMPELLLGGLGGDGKVDPRVTLAIESLSDGCQLEDFNADVAAACAAVCEEPVTRGVLDTIARDERGHAELSWAIVGWLVERHRGVVERALGEAADGLARYPRPTAVAHDKRALVGAASELALRAHGRLPDARWQACWDARLVATRARLDGLLRGAVTTRASAG